MATRSATITARLIAAVLLAVAAATAGKSVAGAPGEDFVATSGTNVTIPAGESQATVPIEVLGDTIDEPPLRCGEWGLVAFSNPSPNAVLDTSLFGLGLFIIIDDDVITSRYDLLTAPGTALGGASFPASGSVPVPFLAYVSGGLIVEGEGVDWYIDEVLFRDNDLDSPWQLAGPGMRTELPIGEAFTGQGPNGSLNTFLLHPGTHTVRAQASYPSGTKNFIATFAITP